MPFQNSGQSTMEPDVPAATLQCSSFSFETFCIRLLFKGSLFTYFLNGGLTHIVLCAVLPHCSCDGMKFLEKLSSTEHLNTHVVVGQGGPAQGGRNQSNIRGAR